MSRNKVLFVECHDSVKYWGQQVFVFECVHQLSLFPVSICLAPDDLQGLACLYLPCSSARPPSMTPSRPGSAPPTSKDLGDSYQIIFLSTYPPLWVQPPHTVDLNHAHCSLQPFGLSSSYHHDGQVVIRQVQPRGRRRVLSTLLKLNSCVTLTLQGSKEVISASSMWYCVSSLPMQMKLTTKVFWFVHCRSF